MSFLTPKHAVLSRRAGLAIIGLAALLPGLAACGVRGDPQLPEGVYDTMPLERQYPSEEVPPPAAEPEAQ